MCRLNAVHLYRFSYPVVHCTYIYIQIKVVHVQAMKAYEGNIGTAPLILVLCTRWRSVTSLTARPLYSQC